MYALQLNRESVVVPASEPTNAHFQNPRLGFHSRRLRIVLEGSKESPVAIGIDDQSKITGKAYVTDKVLKAELYNGAEWTLSDVDVVAAKKGGAERRFRLELWETKYEWEKDAKIPKTVKTKLTLRPFATGEFECNVGDFLDGIATKDDWSWTIVSVRGFKE